MVALEMSTCVVGVARAHVGRRAGGAGLGGVLGGSPSRAECKPVRVVVPAFSSSLKPDRRLPFQVQVLVESAGAGVYISS